MTVADYPWEALEDAIRWVRKNESTQNPEVLARRLIDRLREWGWRLAKEEQVHAVSRAESGEGAEIPEPRLVVVSAVRADGAKSLVGDLDAIIAEVRRYNDEQLLLVATAERVAPETQVVAINEVFARFTKLVEARRPMPHPGPVWSAGPDPDGGLWVNRPGFRFSEDRDAKE